ncbi:L,D-transpeptidase [Luedemannella helvata]|uniref:Ig-like domain-containing protein n=1 Tax=Luedemannella helvata TaxID=349315 RepID=A0ABP4WNR6_9ACTN
MARGSRLAGAVLTIAAASLAACDAAPRPAPPAAPAAAVRPTPPAPLRLAVSPRDGAARVPASTEIGIEITGGRLAAVRVIRAGTRTPVRGSLRADGRAWVPARPLAFGSAYTAVVSATSADGERTETRTTRFRTMGRPAKLTGTGLYMFDGQQYGVAMPVVVEFDPAVPAAARAGVQRRLFVHSDPPQPGAWHWVDGRQAYYRPPAYWLPGTRLTVRTALGGHPTGRDRYGDTDRSASVRIGRSVLIDVDNATKRMRVYRGGRLLRSMPVSLGKPSTPSSSGHHVIMSKEYRTVFDTRREGPGGYRVDITYAQRLTWGGEFIHAAPWSVGDQGRRNVSHGCVNLSWHNAEWLFGLTRVGDPVVIRGTEVHVAPGNGWTAWDQPWEQYVRGGALPVPAHLANRRGR